MKRISGNVNINIDNIRSNEHYIEAYIKGTHYKFSTVNENFVESIKITPEHAFFEMKKINNSKQVFISYSSNSKKFADEVKEQLGNADITVWMDIKILGGDDWRAEIEEALKKSDIVLVLLDKNSVKSHYVTYEWAFALGEKGKDSVIPLVIEDCDIHQRIDKNALQHIDFRDDRNWEKLVEAIKSKLSK